ncbi:AbrB/MazE/SpoVT family DNA-binding domain-containing protein [Patescibacteria group bacterium]|nr:AbrB/MazE/SpoVT family DNA-binding domain-containing protein [Patescibacteria group bacterium]
MNFKSPPNCGGLFVLLVDLRQACIYNVDMITKIKMWGNSLAVRIPRDVSQKLRLHSGSHVQFLTDNKTFTVRPIKKERDTLKDLVSKITKENRQTIKFNNEAHGKEIW